MVLFGKEIKVDTNMSPKEAKLALLVISLSSIIILGYFKIYNPIMQIRDLNVEIKSKNDEKTTEKAKKEEAKKEYDNRVTIYNEQNENYNKSKGKFEHAALMDETDLKDMVAQIAESLGVKIVETGAVEVIEENPEYTKKYFPYTVQADVNRLGRFFGILEVSNRLVTFKGSPLDIQLTEGTGISGEIIVKMKVGAYFNRNNPEVGETNE